MRDQHPSIVARAESTRPKAVGSLLTLSMLSLLTRVWLPLALAALLAGVTLGQVEWFDTAAEGSVEDVRAALQAGAELEARDEYGRTPLMHAARHNENPAVVRVLLDAGADGAARDSLGRTTFDHATDNEAVRGTDAYWLLNDARFR